MMGASVPALCSSQPSGMRASPACRWLRNCFLDELGGGGRGVAVDERSGYLGLYKGIHGSLCTSLQSMLFLFFKILFIYSWETQRERQRHRQREKQAACREPDVGLDPRTPGSHPELSPLRCPMNMIHFKENLLYFIFSWRIAHIIFQLVTKASQAQAAQHTFNCKLWPFCCISLFSK